MESMDSSKKCSDHGGNAAEPAFVIHLLPGPPQKKATLQSSVPLVSFLEVAVVVFTILVPSPLYKLQDFEYPQSLNRNNGITMNNQQKKH